MILALFLDIVIIFLELSIFLIRYILSVEFERLSKVIANIPDITSHNIV
jgi:hypothetical protein